MTLNPASDCPYCKGNNIVRGVKVRQNAEPGNIGLGYKEGFLLRGTSPFFADLCRDCGTIVRLYIQETNRDWVTL